MRGFFPARMHAMKAHLHALLLLWEGAGDSTPSLSQLTDWGDAGEGLAAFCRRLDILLILWHLPLGFGVQSSCGDCAQLWSLPTSTSSGKPEHPATLRRQALPLWSTSSPFSVFRRADSTSPPSTLSIGSPFSAGPPLPSDSLLLVSAFQAVISHSFGHLRSLSIHISL